MGIEDRTILVRIITGAVRKFLARLGVMEPLQMLVVWRRNSLSKICIPDIVAEGEVEGE